MNNFNVEYKEVGISTVFQVPFCQLFNESWIWWDHSNLINLILIPSLDLLYQLIIEGINLGLSSSKLRSANSSIDLCIKFEIEEYFLAILISVVLVE